MAGAVAPNLEAAWAAGYAAYVGRFCPGWQIDYKAEAADGGLPFTLTDAWAARGAASRSFHAGGSAAEAARVHDALFCSAPLAGLHGPSRERASRYLSTEQKP